MTDGSQATRSFGLRYYLHEAAVSAAINAVLSIVFALLVFGGRPSVPTHGPYSLAVDAVPQTFMISLMASLVPMLIARRRFALECARRRVAIDAFGCAIIATAIGGALHWLLLPGSGWTLRAALIYKTVYGATLGAAITVAALRARSRPRA